MGFYNIILTYLLVVSAFIATALATPAHDHAVAFSVGLTNTMYMQNKSIVIYDRVYVNEKNGYDPYTGVFTCPIAGVYLFHFHAYCTNRDTVFWLELQHNQKPVASVSGYNSHTVGSNTVMLKLQQGDHVDVKSKEMQQFALFGLPDQVYSTFTGFMLYPPKAGADFVTPFFG